MSSVNPQEQRLKFLKQQDQRQQQQAAEQEKLKRLKEIAETQEAKLKKVRALKGHVEQKRLSNGKLGEETALGDRCITLMFKCSVLMVLLRMKCHLCWKTCRMKLLGDFFASTHLQLLKLQFYASLSLMESCGYYL